MNSDHRVSLKWTSLLAIGLIVAFFSFVSGDWRAEITVLRQTVERLEHKIGNLESQINQLKFTVDQSRVASHSDSANGPTDTAANNK